MPYDKELIRKVATYVRSQLGKEHTGHDWFHAKRVLLMARRLQAEEGGDLMLIELSALVHDLGDYKRYDYSEAKGNLVLNAMMDILEIEREVQKKIMEIVIQSQYKGTDTKTPNSIEGRIIQDADWLDTLGAVGIARNFATSGDSGRVIYNPSIPPRANLNTIDYQKKKMESTAFNYFFEKSLRLPTLMNTETGRMIAGRRIKFLKLFIRQFLDEWDGRQ